MAVWALVLASALLLPPPAAAAGDEPSRVAGLAETLSDWWQRGASRFRRAEQQPAGDVFQIVSWNVQGASESRGEAAAAVLQEAAGLLSDMRVLAAQEVANARAAERLRGALPRGDWSLSFSDTSNAQDNALLIRGAQLFCQGPLFAGRTAHPIWAARVRMGDFDFTLVTLHLAYRKGDASAAADELRLVLDWAAKRLAEPGRDPDLVIAGDFNLPTNKGKLASKRGGQASWTPIEELISEHPQLRPENGLLGRQPKASELIALVDEPSTRSRGSEATANNYDHFLISGDVFDEEYVHASARAMPAEKVSAAERRAGRRASDHVPIAASFRMRGLGNDGRPIALDGESSCDR